MEKTFKRLLSFAVALVMILGMIPVTQIEAKAATSNEVTVDYCYWKNQTPNTGKDTWQVVPATKTVDLSKINEPLSGTENADGTLSAYCNFCKMNRTWKPVTQAAIPKLASATYDNTHYYLKDDITTSTVTDGYWFYNDNRNVCIHLNGKTLTMASENGQGSIRHGYNSMVIMGEGTVIGNTDDAAEHRGAALTLDFTSTYHTSTINLFGGTYTSSNGRPALGSAGTLGSIYVYPGAVVEGVDMAGGTLSVRGGKVTGEISMSSGILEMLSGEIEMTGGDITVSNTTKTINLKGGEFNLKGGTVKARFRLYATWVAANQDYDYATLNMTGGTINGIGEKDARATISDYGGAAVFAQDGATVNISGGTVNGGWLADTSSSYASAIYITGGGISTTVGETVKKTRTTTLNISGDAKIFGQGYYDAEGNVLPEADQAKNGQTGTIQLYGEKYDDTAFWPNGDGAQMFMTGGTVYGGYSTAASVVQAAPGNIDITGGTIYGGKIARGAGVINMSGHAQATVKNHLNIKNVTINGIHAATNGGAIVASNTDLRIEDSKITGGTAGSTGGNLYLTGGTTAYIKDTEISGGTGLQGGNIYATASSVILDGCTISGGTATDTGDIGYHGGGNIVIHDTTGELTTINTLIEKGSATNGANILVSKGTAHLNEGTEIKDGKATGLCGGGAINLSTGTLNINGAYIHDNTSVKNEANNTGAFKQVCVYWNGTVNMYSGRIADNDDEAISVYLVGYLESIKDGSGTVTSTVAHNTYLNIYGGSLGTRMYPDQYAFVTVNDGEFFGFKGVAVKPENTTIHHGVFHYNDLNAESLAMLAEGAEAVVVDGVFYVHNRGEKTAEQENSCTQDGYTTFVCTTCEEEYTPVTTEQKQHSYTGENGVCVNGCGKTQCQNDGHDYQYAYKSLEKHTVTCSRCDLNEEEAHNLPCDKCNAIAPKGQFDEETKITVNLQEAYMSLPLTGVEGNNDPNGGNIVVKLYYGEKAPFATVTLKTLAPTGVEGCKITIPGMSSSNSWTTELHVSELTRANIPNQVEIYVNDVLVDTYEGELLANPADYAAALVALCQVNHDALEEGENHVVLCEKCGYTVTNDHVFEAVVSDNTLKTPATCTEPAVYFKSCSCGAESEETFNGTQTLEHAYTGENGVCVNGCGKTVCENTQHNFVENADKKYEETPATCTSVAVYKKSCSVCGAESEETFNGTELAAHTPVAQDGKAAQVEVPGWEAYYKCSVCKKLFSDEACQNQIEKPVEIPALPKVETTVPETVTGATTEEQKTAVKDVVENSTKVNEVENLPANTQLKITATAATFSEEGKITRLTYDVTPYTAGVKVDTLTDEITFNLPVPETDKNKVAVFHGEEFLGMYQVQTDGTEKWVEVKASSFSPYIVDVEHEEGEAKIGDVSYPTLKDALAAAAANGGQIDLQKAVSIDQLTLPNNTTLNLNGQVLTITNQNSYIIAYTTNSFIIDTSEGNVGRLMAAASKLRLLEDNGYLPVDLGEEGIMFCQVTLGHGKPAGEGKNYQSWISSANETLLNALKTTNASELGLKFQARICWGNNVLIYTFTDAVVKQYAANWDTWALHLKLNGAENVEGLTYEAAIVFGTTNVERVVVRTGNPVAH